ncbi:MAG TPA: hypothetical protein VK858_17305 [Longimicrobiales bacterium]|nr:hypothetical protein [Longimicrobiales bacterium]
MGPAEAYRRRAAELTSEEERLAAELTRLGTFRILAFMAAAALFVAGDVLGMPVVTGASVLALAGFVVLVRRYRRTRTTLARDRIALELARQGLARLDRRWDDLPPTGPGPAGIDTHRYAGDLDLFGRASLFALLGPVQTPMGRERVTRWLLEPTSPDAIPGRQAAIRELAAATEQREAAAVDGARVEPVSGEKLERFLKWCEGGDDLTGALRTAAWVLPLVTLLLAVGDVLDLVPTAGWVLGVLVQGVLAYRVAARLHAGFARASSGVPGIRQYADLFQRWEHWTAEAPLLREEVALLNRDGRYASDALSALGRILHLADLRLSMIHPVLAVGVLWDLNLAAALDRWRRRWGHDVAGWMEALGHLEGLSALATLAADHPDWAFPDAAREVGAGEAVRFEARDLGHPLIPPDRCVRNDVELGPPGTVLLVTGSNMSGKSTLLRSIGLAVVLARAGGPVCATELHLPPVRLFTSMRVRDSVEAGVSYFMAELLRLKALLDAAPQPDAPGDEPPLLYLVDEVLQGTNSEERQVAGRRLIRHLLRRRAIGAVTTHDLDLHRGPRVQPHAVLVHFRESVDEEGHGLTFDYRLRPGLATTRNALLLAERIGLTEPDVG